GAGRPQRWRAPGPGIRVAIHFGFLAQTLMKILQLISSAGHYGAENMLLNLAKSLERLGCTCVLGVFENLHRPSTEIAEHAQQLGLQTVAIRCQGRARSEEHTSELQSRGHLVCRLLLEKKNTPSRKTIRHCSP